MLCVNSCRTNLIQLKGTRYSIGCIVVLDSEPTFGLLIDILLTDVDICLFVCDVLKTGGHVEHLHAFEVIKEKPTPVVFYKQTDSADHHPLASYELNDAMYIVPKYVIDD